MYRYLVVLLAALGIPAIQYAKVFPKEGAVLNYTWVGFSADALNGGSNVKFEVAIGYYNSPDSFNRNIMVTANSKNGMQALRLPAFGSQYTWRVLLTNPQGGLQAGSLMHFSTGFIPMVDTNHVRLHVTTADKLRKDGFLFLDFNKVLYDINGVPLWYLKPFNGAEFDRMVVRDLKLTPQHTISLIMNDVPYEIDYDCNVLWKAPNNGKISGDSLEYYHHEFTRLNNGNYMALGGENKLWTPSTPVDPATPVGTKKIAFGTVIEYNRAGEVVWSWKSSPFYEHTNIKYERTHGSEYDIHQNAFCFDEKNRALYVSFKNIDQVVKVNYPAGTIANTYSRPLFCLAHNCRKSPKGYMMIFNNNSCADNPIPKLTFFSEPASGKGPGKKIWEFDCPVLATNMHKDMKPKITNGGSLAELSDNSVFASNCSPYADIFIVTRSKKITWYAVPQQWDVEGHRWFVLPQYRASFVERASELEKVIFNR